MLVKEDIEHLLKCTCKMYIEEQSSYLHGAIASYINVLDNAELNKKNRELSTKEFAEFYLKTK